MHLLKSRIDINIFIDMCMHENDDNDSSYNCHHQHGIDIGDLEKCVNCTRYGKKEGNCIFYNHIYVALALTLLYNGMLIHGVSPSELLIGTMMSLQKDKRKAHHRSDNYRALTFGSIIGKLYDDIIIKL